MIRVSRPMRAAVVAILAGCGLAAISPASAAPAASPGYLPQTADHIETVARKARVVKRGPARRVYVRRGVPIGAALGVLAAGAAAAAAAGAFDDDDGYVYAPRRRYYDPGYAPVYGGYAPGYGGGYYAAPTQRYYRRPAAPVYAPQAPLPAQVYVPPPQPPVYGRPPVAAPRYAPRVGRPAPAPYYGGGPGYAPPFVPPTPGLSAGN